MRTLTKKAYGNLSLLLSMGENDIFMGKRGELILQDDFVQVDNINEIEHTIYFTYHQLLTSSDMGVFLNSNLIKTLDESIDSIFDNKQFIELLEDEGFKCMVDDIDQKIETLKESYFYKSPFFTFLKNSYNLYGYFKDIMVENDEYIRKLFQITRMDSDTGIISQSDSEEDDEEEEEEEDDTLTCDEDDDEADDEADDEKEDDENIQKNKNE